MKVEIYSDVACPWCYIGEKRFERALTAYAGADEVEVVYRPFQLDPNAPETAVPMLEYLEGRFGKDISGMVDRVVENARGEGLSMDYERGLAVNTLNAHRLMRFAEREYGPEVQRAVATRLFEAHFAKGVDVSAVDALVQIASESGIDAERVRGYLASDAGLQEVRAEITQAQRIGVSAVPTFVFEGKYAVQGAQPTSTFLQALETVKQEIAGSAADDSAADACSDGSCSI